MAETTKSRKGRPTKGEAPNAIRELREARGWGQVQLETATGIDKGYLSKLERGLVGCSDASRDRLAAAFGVSVEDLRLPAGGTPASSPIYRYPVYALARVSEDGEAVRVSVEPVSWEKSFEPSDALQVLEVGEGFEPGFCPLDRLLVDATAVPQDGDLVVAERADKFGVEIALKWWKASGASAQLVPVITTPESKTLPFNAALWRVRVIVHITLSNTPGRFQRLIRK